MIKDIDVAKYYLKKDDNHSVFSNNLITRNGRTFYEGNARINKYLHLAQNIYISMYGKPLFETVFYAYDNGVVSKDVQENYARLTKIDNEANVISSEDADYLDKIYEILKEANIDELIELSHEDIEWQEKSRFYNLQDQVMDSLNHVDEYKKQYEDIVKYIERM